MYLQQLAALRRGGTTKDFARLNSIPQNPERSFHVRSHFTN
jgi:hypothetical protein